MVAFSTLAVCTVLKHPACLYYLEIISLNIKWPRTSFSKFSEVPVYLLSLFALFKGVKIFCLFVFFSLKLSQLVKQLQCSHLFTYFNSFRWCTVGLPIVGSLRIIFISIFFKTLTLRWQARALCWMCIFYVSDQNFAKMWWCILIFNPTQWDPGFILD